MLFFWSVCTATVFVYCGAVLFGLWGLAFGSLVGRPRGLPFRRSLAAFDLNLGQAFGPTFGPPNPHLHLGSGMAFGPTFGPTFAAAVRPPFPLFCLRSVTAFGSPFSAPVPARSFALSLPGRV